MATKEQAKVLIWKRKHDEKRTTYWGYRFTSWEGLLNQLFYTNIWGSLNSNDIPKFCTDLKNNMVKVIDVGKNRVRKGDEEKFAGIDNGDYFANARISKDTSKFEIHHMSDDVRNWLGCYGTYCKLENIKDLTEEEKEDLLANAHNILGLFNVDDVFNAFATLCHIRNDKDIITMGGYTTPKENKKNIMVRNPNSKRNEMNVIFDTSREYNLEKIKEIENETRKTIEAAHKLTTAMTGCELYLKDHKDVDFVDGFIASRHYANEFMSVETTNKPQVLFKDILRIADGELENKELSAAAKRIFKHKHIIAGADTPHIEKLFDMSGITVLPIPVDEVKQKQIHIEDFDGIPKCFTWQVDTPFGDCGFITVFMYDETVTVFEMVDKDIEAFLQVMRNKQ